MNVTEWRLKFLAKIGNGSTPDRENPDYWERDGYPWLNSSVVNDDEVKEPSDFVSATALRECHLPIVAPGSILVGLTGQGKNRGMASLLTFEATINQHLAFVAPDHSKADPRFLRWVLVSKYQTLREDSDGGGSTKGALTCEGLKEIPVPLVSPSDQRRVAAYLDAETAQMDALVAEKEQMLKLLEEKRAAQISHAVTRGLNPRAPLKPSALPWLGDIPKHWEVRPLKFITRSIQIGPFGSQLHAEDYVEDGIPVINPAHLRHGEIKADSRVAVDAETAARLSVHRLEAEDLVFARRGELGRCGVVANSQKGWLCGTGSLRLRPNHEVASKYVALIFTATAAADWLTTESIGSTMDNLNTEMVANFKIPLPPLSEQRAIVAHLAAERERTAGLEAALRDSIHLLQERRRALITAAVTGQIAIPQLSA